MKIVSPDILHKTDAGGVALNIESAGAAREAFERLVANGRNYKADANIFGVMLTPMLKGGVECIIGSSWDSTFGPTVMFGLGGIFVEILKDVSFRVAPVNMPSCRRMVREINGLAMLQGAAYGGRTARHRGGRFEPRVRLGKGACRGGCPHRAAGALTENGFKGGPGFPALRRRDNFYLRVGKKYA